MTERLCILCRRPLPKRRWWQLSQLILEPPPFCLDRRETCRILWVRRVQAELEEEGKSFDG